VNFRLIDFFWLAVTGSAQIMRFELKNLEPKKVFFKKIRQNLYFWPKQLRKNAPEIKTTIAILLENALILGNPHDEKGEIICCMLSKLHNQI